MGGAGRVSNRGRRVPRWARPRPSPPSRPASSCSQADRFTASSAPHIHTVLAARLAEGRCRSAAPCLASRIRSSMSVRIRCQASTATVLAGVDTSRLVAMNEYAYTWPTRPSNARASWSLGMVRRRRARGSVEMSCARTLTRRSEEHTSELQSLRHLVCRLLLEKKKKVLRQQHDNQQAFERLYG